MSVKLWRQKYTRSLIAIQGCCLGMDYKMFVYLVVSPNPNNGNWQGVSSANRSLHNKSVCSNVSYTHINWITAGGRWQNLFYPALMAVIRAVKQHKQQETDKANLFGGGQNGDFCWWPNFSHTHIKLARRQVEKCPPLRLLGLLFYLASSSFNDKMSHLVENQCMSAFWLWCCLPLWGLSIGYGRQLVCSFYYFTILIWNDRIVGEEVALFHSNLFIQLIKNF